MRLRDRIRWDLTRLLYQARKVFLRSRVGERWVEEDGGLARRDYPDYATYVEHQKTKFGALRSSSVLAHDRRFFDALAERLRTSPLELKGRSVLCLAARQGTEVRAFIDQGAFAVGIDLNPGPGNRYVVVGDFHDLQFGDASVDLVYTNSLDHAFELDRILAEVRRVLRPDGVFVVEANGAGDGDGAAQGAYEALVWDGPDALLGRLEAGGFRLRASEPFDAPWPGRHLVLAPA